MTEEEFIAKKKYAGEKKPSMKRRNIYHDYSERRMYMITLEVEGRLPVFGRLVGNAFAERGSRDEPRIELSELGKAVQSEWFNIQRYYPQIEVMAIQMMPDHLHGILFVKDTLPVHLGQVISGFKTGCRRAQKAIEAARDLETAVEPQYAENGATTGKETRNETAENGATTGKETRNETTENGATTGKDTKNETAENGATTGKDTKNETAENGATTGKDTKNEAKQEAAKHEATGSSYVTASPLLQSKPRSHQLFAKGYNDLILRSFDEFPIWKNYLRDNPRRLMMKRARPEFLRPFFGLRIGSHSYSGIGNRHLLAATKRIAVRVSRRMSDREIAAETVRYLDAAQQGAVLVSPAISPGEKSIMRAAFDAGLPTIVIMENGFTPLSKPHGEQFDACARGRLLMLSPWDHHNEKKKITAEQCQQMNLMALEISR